MKIRLIILVIGLCMLPGCEIPIGINGLSDFNDNAKSLIDFLKKFDREHLHDLHVPEELEKTRQVIRDLPHDFERAGHYLLGVLLRQTLNDVLAETDMHVKGMAAYAEETMRGYVTIVLEELEEASQEYEQAKSAKDTEKMNAVYRRFCRRVRDRLSTFVLFPRFTAVTPVVRFGPDGKMTPDRYLRISGFGFARPGKQSLGLEVTLSPGERKITLPKERVLLTADSLIQIDLGEVKFAEDDTKLTIKGYLNMPDSQRGPARRVDSEYLLTEIGVQKEATPPEPPQPKPEPPKPYLSEVVVTFETLSDDKDEGEAVHIEVLEGNTVCCQADVGKNEQWEDKNPGWILNRHSPKNNPREVRFSQFVQKIQAGGAGAIYVRKSGDKGLEFQIHVTGTMVVPEIVNNKIVLRSVAKRFIIEDKTKDFFNHEHQDHRFALTWSN